MANPLAASFEEAIAYLNQLEQVLGQERLALETQSHEDLQENIKLKSQLLNNIDKNNSDRSTFLIGLGLKNGQPGVEDYLEQQTDNDATALRAQWQTLQQALQNCKQLNMVNGKVVHRSRQQVDHILGIMRGQTGQPKLYDQSGGTEGVSRQQPLASA